MDNKQQMKGHTLSGGEGSLLNLFKKTIKKCYSSLLVFFALQAQDGEEHSASQSKHKHNLGLLEEEVTL